LCSPISGEASVFEAALIWQLTDTAGRVLASDFIERVGRELELYADTILAILSCPKPMICELNGDAVGWGATIALYCDIIIANQSARIGDPHVNVGLSTGDGASIIWPQLAGYPRARQLLLTGELISAEQASRYGLVNEAVDSKLLRARKVVSP